MNSDDWPSIQMPENLELLNEIADNSRSLGLGLSLCKTIINAHGSELELRDNTPHGCIFEFKLQLSEVHLNE